MPKPLFRVIVAGSRDFYNYPLLAHKLDELLHVKKQTHEIHIVSGMARGADLLGVDYAESRNFQVDQYPAEWKRYGNNAGYIRNVIMAKNADALVAFWNGYSRGTRHMIETAQKYQLEIRIVQV